MRLRRAGGWCALALPAALLFHTGWTTRRAGWRDATGWRELAGAPRPDDHLPLDDGAARLGWLGHAGFVLDWRGRRILVDPNLSLRCTISRRILERSIEPLAIGPVDAVLVSHAHFDHLDRPTLTALTDVGTVVVPRGSEAWVQGVARTVAGLDVGDRRRIGDLEIVAVPAVHNGHRLHPLGSEKLAVGYVVRDVDRPADAIYFAGDTGWGPHFELIRRELAPRVAVLPIGAFAPRWPLRFYHLSPEEAVAAAQALGVEVVVPAHFGTFALSLDRPATALPRFGRAAAAAGVPWLMPRLVHRPQASPPPADAA